MTEKKKEDVLKILAGRKMTKRELIVGHWDQFSKPEFDWHMLAGSKMKYFLGFVVPPIVAALIIFALYMVTNYYRMSEAAFARYLSAGFMQHFVLYLIYLAEYFAVAILILLPTFLISIYTNLSLKIFRILAPVLYALFSMVVSAGTMFYVFSNHPAFRQQTDWEIFKFAMSSSYMHIVGGLIGGWIFCKIIFFRKEKKLTEKDTAQIFD